MKLHGLLVLMSFALIAKLAAQAPRSSAIPAPTFKSVVLFVNDIPASRHFYEDLLGQQVENDVGAYLVYAGGLALWDAKRAARFVYGSTADDAPQPARGRAPCEVYFEMEDVEGIAARLAHAGAGFVHQPREEPWAQRTVRVYDPDGHVVEIGEPMPAVVRRLARAGLDREAISKRTGMPPAKVEGILAGP